MIFTLAPGGFIVFACLLALVNKLMKDRRIKREHNCVGCPAAEACGKALHRRTGDD